MTSARRSDISGSIIYGVSYGAQAALQYLRQYPAHVRSVVVAGVATPAAKQPLNFAKAAHHAMNTLIEDCASDVACHGAFPKLNAEFAAVLATFDRGPVTFELLNPASTVKEPVSMSRGVFVERLRLMLYDLDGASRVPLVIHRAARGDWAPFATFSPGGATSGVSAMYLTVTCSETVSRITEEDIVRESRDTFVGEYRTRTHVRACQEWPRGEIPPSYYEPVRSGVPVLMLSGELDAATPRTSLARPPARYPTAVRSSCETRRTRTGMTACRLLPPPSWPRARRATWTPRACRVCAARPS
jgi:pimeloyl-ACP methyl ester carboxylesterase